MTKTNEAVCREDAVRRPAVVFLCLFVISYESARGVRNRTFSHNFEDYFPAEYVTHLEAWAGLVYCLRQLLVQVTRFPPPPNLDGLFVTAPDVCYVYRRASENQGFI